MKNNKKISVIIPTHNRSWYLRRAIQSVIDQDYKNIEIIVIDDASTDDTKEALKPFISSNNIIYIRNEKRMGPNHSRNIGLKKATGDYIAFLDDDDYYCDRGKLRKQINLFEKNSKLGFVGSGYYDKSINKNRIPRVRGKIDKTLLTTFSDIETSTILIKKEIIDKVGFLDERFKSEQNHDFFYRISKIAEFDYIPDIAVVKDNPPSQISTNIKNKLQGYFLFHKKHFEDIRELGAKFFILIIMKLLITSLILVIEAIIGNSLILPKLYETIRNRKYHMQ